MRSVRVGFKRGKVRPEALGHAHNCGSQIQTLKKKLHKPQTFWSRHPGTFYTVHAHSTVYSGRNCVTSLPWWGRPKVRACTCTCIVFRWSRRLVWKLVITCMYFISLDPAATARYSAKLGCSIWLKKMIPSLLETMRGTSSACICGHHGICTLFMLFIDHSGVHMHQQLMQWESSQAYNFS